MLAKCAPGAVPWIEHVFGDCIMNARDAIGFSLGLASISCWLVAQVPQLYRNYRNQSAEALSPWFLAEWLLGDTFNLLGALLKGDQLPTVVFTAQYFICVDAVMLVQYLYYISLQRRRERMAVARRHRRRRHHGGGRRHAHHSHHSQQQQHDHGSGDEHEAQQQDGSAGWDSMDGAAAAAADGEIRPSSSSAAAGGSSVLVPVVSSGARDVSFRPQRAALGCLGVLALVANLRPQPPAAADAQQQIAAEQQPGGLHRRLLMAAAAALSSSGGLGVHLPHWSYTAGTALGYCSSLLYLTSRVSQIWKNHGRQSAEGLAISMFLCAVAANSCYGASILVRSYTWPELRSSLPWLIGSLGTVALDLCIYAQWRAFNRAAAKHHPSDEEDPLLPPA